MPADATESSAALPNERPNTFTPASKWLAFATLCLFTGAAWLGAIERANLNTDRFLQALNETPVAEREEAWGQSVSRESLREQIAVDDAGAPLAEPIPLAIEEEVDHAWRPYAAKRHLKLMLTGFGPIVYPMVALSWFCCFRALKRTPGVFGRSVTVLVLFLGLVVLWRGLSLGILRHGWLA